MAGSSSGRGRASRIAAVDCWLAAGLDLFPKGWVSAQTGSGLGSGSNSGWGSVPSSPL
jgi:hypothetical protein